MLGTVDVRAVELPRERRKTIRTCLVNNARLVEVIDSDTTLSAVEMG